MVVRGLFQGILFFSYETQCAHDQHNCELCLLYLHGKISSVKQPNPIIFPYSTQFISIQMLGGIKAVVYTDVLQAFVMIASITTVAILGIIQTGGISEVWDRAVEGDRIFSPM